MVKYEFLKIDHDEEDNFIKLLIKASRSFVENYLNAKFTDYGEDYPAEFDLARLQLIGQWYEDRVIMSPRSNVKEMAYVFSGLLDPHRNWQLGAIGSETVEGMYYNYNQELARFYRSEVVDTHTSVKGHEKPPESTTFYAQIGEVDYNQRWKRDGK